MPRVKGLSYFYDFKLFHTFEKVLKLVAKNCQKSDFLSDSPKVYFKYFVLILLHYFSKKHCKIMQLGGYFDIKKYDIIIWKALQTNYCVH